MTWNVLQHIETATIDYEAGHVEIRTVDGHLVREQGRGWSIRTSDAPLDFKRVTFRPRDCVLTMVTPVGQVLEAETFDDRSISQRRAERPVVYLDQNKWVQVAQAVNRTEKVHGPEREATSRLIDMAQSQEVILPISSAHSIETETTGGRWREDLALQMVGLSRGWIMIDPLRVRALELQALFTNLGGNEIPPIEAPVFTLDPREFHAETNESYQPKNPDLPPEAVFLIESLIGIQAVLAVLLENEASRREGVEEASRWAQVHQKLAMHLAQEAATKPHLREITLLAFISDLGDDLLRVVKECAITSPEFQRWVEERADGDIIQLPYLGRKRELVHQRLVNPQVRWVLNDLIDVLFLPCAAGYADYVVCEKQTADYLQKIGQSRPGGAKVLTRIAELVERLES